MPTDKPRVTFAVSEETLSQIDNYRYENKCKNQYQRTNNKMYPDISFRLNSKSHSFSCIFKSI